MCFRFWSFKWFRCEEHSRPVVIEGEDSAADAGPSTEPFRTDRVGPPSRGRIQLDLPEVLRPFLQPSVSPNVEVATGRFVKRSGPPFLP